MLLGEEQKWLVTVLISAIPGIAAFVLGVLAHRRDRSKDEHEAEEAEDRAGQAARAALNADQRALFADLKSDIVRLREERDQRTTEASRFERIARAWESWAHKQRHDHNGVLHVIKLTNPGIELPAGWGPLPSFDQVLE